MARRGGKAANRRDRQRRAQRKALQRPVAPPRPITGVVSDAVDEAAERRTETAPARFAPSTSPASRGARADPRFAVAGPSRLSERAAAEYHYVRSDLRNIAVLVVVMAVMLGVAVVAFGAMGIGSH
jgi:hypothetical protein